MTVTPFVRQYPLLLQNCGEGFPCTQAEGIKPTRAFPNPNSLQCDKLQTNSPLTEKQRAVTILNFKSDQGSPTKKTQHFKGLC